MSYAGYKKGGSMRRIDQAYLTAVLWALIILGGCTQPAHILERDQYGSYSWHRKDEEMFGLIYIDNGSSVPLILRLDERSSITVPADGTRVRLWVPAGPLPLSVFTSSGAPFEHLTPIIAATTHGSFHHYIYNPAAAWDYVITTYYYSIFRFGGSNTPQPKKQFIRRNVFFISDCNVYFGKPPDTSYLGEEAVLEHAGDPRPTVKSSYSSEGTFAPPDLSGGLGNH